MRRRVPDVSKLRGLIGFAPETDLDETLCRIIQTHQAHVPQQTHAVGCAVSPVPATRAVTEHLRLAQ